MGNFDTVLDIFVVDDHVEPRLKCVGKRRCEGGDQDAAVVPLGQHVRAVQCHDGLASPGAACHPGRTLEGRFDHGTLSGMKINPPRREWVREDVHQLVGTVDEDDPVAAPQDCGIEVFGVDRLFKDRGTEVGPDLFGCVSSSETEEDIPLGFGKQ